MRRRWWWPGAVELDVAIADHDLPAPLAPDNLVVGDFFLTGRMS